MMGKTLAGKNPASEFQVTTLEKSTNKNRGYKSQQLLVWVWLSMSMMMAMKYVFFFFFFNVLEPQCMNPKTCQVIAGWKQKNTIMFSRNSIDQEVSSQVSRFIYSW